MKGTWIRQSKGDAVVVFVHGVLSDSRAWQHPNGTYWPELLSRDQRAADVAVYVFEYQTNFFSGTYQLGDVVASLENHMRLDAALDYKRVAFVCHSMGGIVVRRYLVRHQIDLIAQSKAIGLFLIASPSLGSAYANWLAPLARIVKHSQADALRFSQGNAWLNDLDHDFLDMKERKQLLLLGKELVEDKFIVSKFWLAEQVVPPFAGAKYFGQAYKVPASTHFTIAKVEGPQSIQHRLLVEFLQDLEGIQSHAGADASRRASGLDGSPGTPSGPVHRLREDAGADDAPSPSRAALLYEATTEIDQGCTAALLQRSRPPSINYSVEIDTRIKRLSKIIEDPEEFIANSPGFKTIHAREEREKVASRQITYLAEVQKDLKRAAHQNEEALERLLSSMDALRPSQDHAHAALRTFAAVAALRVIRKLKGGFDWVGEAPRFWLEHFRFESGPAPLSFDLTPAGSNLGRAVFGRRYWVRARIGRNPEYEKYELITIPLIDVLSIFLGEVLGNKETFWTWIMPQLAYHARYPLAEFPFDEWEAFALHGSNGQEWWSRFATSPWDVANRIEVAEL